MSSSLQSDFTSFGFEPDEEEKENIEQPETPSQDYKQFGLEEEKPKAGPAESAWLGLKEGVLGIPALVQYGANEISKGLEKAFDVEVPEMTFEQENPILSYLSTFPKSEDETSRRIRTGVSGASAGAMFGIPGIVAGLVGSQAGQTVREVWGKEGEFEGFGGGEIAAIATDLLAGGTAGVATSLARGGAQTARNIPDLFRRSNTLIDRALVKHQVQGGKQALQTIINEFSEGQIAGFEDAILNISPHRFAQLSHTDAAALQQHADNIFRSNQLNLISPIAATPEQGGRAIQDSANVLFQQNVQQAERQAYGAATQAAQGLEGEAPRTIQQAKALRDNLTRNAPTPEQNPLVRFLNLFIQDLETMTPEEIVPASKLVGSNGKPLIAQQVIPASEAPTTKSANDMVDLVQKANAAVNYESEFREQSHRLAPILSTFRNEVGDILAQNPAARRLYQAANNLHAQNAEIWGTKYMRNVRYTENPESIISQTKKASNMANLKQAITDPIIQGLAERQVIGNITESGSESSNRTAINNLAPELSLNARNASVELVNVKDPLTSSGGRAAIRNEILKDAAQAVNTGKRPEKILDLMQTPQGYQLVRETFSPSQQGRRLFRSFERAFVEDIFNSITDQTGKIDFKKATKIFQNHDVRQVVENIGGRRLVNQFEELQSYARNFESNLSLYKKPETKSLFKSLFKNVKDAGLVGFVLHGLHMPWPVIAGLGLVKAAGGLATFTFNKGYEKILSNPNAVRLLQRVSRANTVEELSKQLPRLIAEIEKTAEPE